ncbi:hypothetical protein [Bythopirellula polymerisocia]|uniref:hypothetical protein n=1 Tax=Bythopirellula polymerisocia TaxID=2528003 RepID=UPI0011B47BF9|nr:hypothetical protein [Bythopirellula polymerisocia]
MMRFLAEVCCRSLVAPRYAVPRARSRLADNNLISPRQTVNFSTAAVKWEMPVPDRVRNPSTSPYPRKIGA